MSECESKGIPVKYEKVNLVAMQKFIPMMKNITKVKNVQISRVAYTAKSIEALYAEAKENLSAFLSGTKTPLSYMKNILNLKRTHPIL